MSINKKIVNGRSISIFVCVLAILISIIIIFKPSNKGQTVDGVKVVQGTTKEREEISEQEAKKMALKQFKKLHEKISEEQLNLMKIQRKGEEYYYITSPENSLEIKIKGGKITKINTVTID